MIDFVFKSIFPILLQNKESGAKCASCPDGFLCNRSNFLLHEKSGKRTHPLSCRLDNSLEISN